MEWDLPEEVVQEQGGVVVEGEEVEVEWGEHAPEPDPVGVVSALIAELRFLIKSGCRAITSLVLNAAPRW